VTQLGRDEAVDTMLSNTFFWIHIQYINEQHLGNSSDDALCDEFNGVCPAL